MYIRGLDGTDNRIVNLLMKDGRMSYTDIAEQVGLSRTAVKARIDALEQSGVIRGYTVVLNTHAEEPVTAILNIETKPEQFDACKRLFAQARETVTVVQTSGDNRLVAVCAATDVQAIRDFVTRMYQTAPGIVSIRANSVLDVVKGSLLPEG